MGHGTFLGGVLYDLVTLSCDLLTSKLVRKLQVTQSIFLGFVGVSFSSSWQTWDRGTDRQTDDGVQSIVWLCGEAA